MNKKTIKILALVFTAVLLAAAAIWWLIPIIMIGISQRNADELLLDTSVSPDGRYTIEVYKTQPGATVDYSIKAYLVTDGDKALVYYAYHEYEADVFWLDNDVISINDRTLNITLGETYDWNKKYN